MFLDLFSLSAIISAENFGLLTSFLAVVMAISSHTKRVLLSPSSKDNVLFAISMIVGLLLGIHLVRIKY